MKKIISPLVLYPDERRRSLLISLLDKTYRLVFHSESCISQGKLKWRDVLMDVLLFQSAHMHLQKCLVTASTKSMPYRRRACLIPVKQRCSFGLARSVFLHPFTVIGQCQYPVQPAIVGPVSRRNLRPGDEMAVFRCQQDQEIHWHFFQLQPFACLAKLIAVAIQIEFVEFD